MNDNPGLEETAATERVRIRALQLRRLGGHTRHHFTTRLHDEDRATRPLTDFASHKRSL